MHDKKISQKEEDLVTRVAWLYYQEKMTQHEIAQYISLSRQKVQRLLERAKDVEIVRFRIKHPYFNLLRIEREVVKKYGLKDAVIVPAVTFNEEHLRRSFANACAGYFERLLLRERDLIIGLGWGNTTAYMAEYFEPPTHTSKIEIVSLIGNLMLNVAMNPYITAERIASQLNAPFYNIWAPAIAQTKERAEIFKSEPWIKEVLSIARRSNVAIISVGEVSQSASLFKMGYLSNSDLERLKKKKAVGDILSRFIDARGCVISDEIHDRVISISLDVLQNPETLVIAVSGGPTKFDAIRGAIFGGYIDVLVTDENIAKRLIDLP